MARLRRPAEPPSVAVDQVPPELLDHDAAAWATPGAFQAWCRQHLGRELGFIPLGDRGPFHRFSAAAQHWAAMNNLELPGQYGGTDWARLSELGINRPRRLRKVVL